MRVGGGIGGGGSQVIHYHPRDIDRGRGCEAEEEWVTKKKVEITTTKNVEKKIQRQVVLQDGRVVEEEVPTVTLDTTQDMQTFETDHDEDRKVEEGSGMDLLQSKFPSKSGLLVGDKFTSVKKIQDVKENTVTTEAATNMGDIRSKDLVKVFKEKEDIRKFLRKNDKTGTELVRPTTVASKRNHRVVTDKEDIQERNWLNDGKMQNERIKTEEHIEYDSDDTPDSGASSTSVSSRHKLEPEVYKTRKDENFVEYFKLDRSTGQEKLVKVGEGAHYVAESKELELEQDRTPLQHRSPRLTHVNDSTEKRSKKPITHTDSWLERHFGSSSSELSASSVDISLGGHGSQRGGLRRSASICDIRPVTQDSNVYYATVRKTGQVPPVTRREKKDAYYHENRRSAHFTSSGQPVRPPRRKKNTDSESSHYMSQNNLYESSKSFAERAHVQKPEYIYGTLKKSGDQYRFSRDEVDQVRGERPRTGTPNSSANQRSLETSARQSSTANTTRELRENEKNLRHHAATSTDKYYFGRPTTVNRSANSRTNYHHSSNSRSYSPAPQNISRSSKTHHQSTGNIYAQSLGRKPRSQPQVLERNLRSHHGSTGNIYNKPLESSSKSHHQSTGNIYRSSTSEYKSTGKSHQGTRIGHQTSRNGHQSTRNGHQSTENGHQSTRAGHQSAENSYKGINNSQQGTGNSHQSTGNGHQSTGNIQLERSMHQTPVDNSRRSEDLYSVGSRTREIPILVSGQIYTSTPKPVFGKKGSPAGSGEIYAKPDSTFSLGRNRSRDMVSGRSKIYGSPQQHKILYSAQDTHSPSGSPSTKYRTKIVLNGGIA